MSYKMPTTAPSKDLIAMIAATLLTGSDPRAKTAEIEAEMIARAVARAVAITVEVDRVSTDPNRPGPQPTPASSSAPKE